MVSAFSIGTSQRTNVTKLQNTTTPGPGQYEPEKSPKQNSPKWAIGTSQRIDWNNGKNPGPGTYDASLKLVSNKENTSSFSFGLKLQKDEEEKQKLIPGPGAYNPHDLFQTQPSYSLRKKLAENSEIFSNPRSKSPGPGKYETNYSTVSNVPSYKIGNETRYPKAQYFQEEVPGPGKYLNIKYSPQMPKFGFGSQARLAPIQEQSSIGGIEKLGPGTYESKSLIRKDIGPVMVPRRQDLPGPGAYNPQKQLHKFPEFKIGSESRSLSPKSFVPGPGQYSPSVTYVKEQFPQFRIGTSPKIIEDFNEKTPGIINAQLKFVYILYSQGPGTYNIKSKVIEGPKHIMVPRRENLDFKKLRDKSPGPDKYDLNLSQVKEKHPNYIFGNSNRIPLENINEIPGPGKYQEKKIISTETPQYSFGKEDRQKQTNTQSIYPGPGKYDIKPLFADVPKYLISDEKQKKVHL